MIPRPRPAIADDALWRPDWLQGDNRDRRILWLDKNENRDPEQLALVARVVSGLDQEFLSTYPSPARLYHKLAAWVGVEGNQLVLAAGSDGVIRSVFETFISVGDTVVITQPTFAMYPVYCRIYGARSVAVAYQSSDEGPVLKASDLIATIRAEKPRLVCVPNPDSPTGTVFFDSDLRAIIAAAGDAGAAILVDEAYFPFHTTVVPLIAEFPHLIVARTSAKAWGMAGLRIGYGVASPEVTRMLHKVRSMYECSTVAMAALEAMLDHVDETMGSVTRLEAGKKFFLDAMEQSGFPVLRAKGNFMHVAFGLDGPAIHAALGNICYYRKDFNEPCLKGYSRFSSTTIEQFRPVVEAIHTAIKRENNA